MCPNAVVAVSVAELALNYAVVWLWRLRTDDAGMMDSVWDAAPVCAAVYSALDGPGVRLKRLLAVRGGVVWGHAACHASVAPHFRQARGRTQPAVSRLVGGRGHRRAIYSDPIALPLTVASDAPHAYDLHSACVLNRVDLAHRHNMRHRGLVGAMAGKALADYRLDRRRPTPERPLPRVPVAVLAGPPTFSELTHWLASTVLALPLPCAELPLIHS